MKSTRKGDLGKLDVQPTGVGSRGNPLLKVGGVPGYNKGEGTPGWIKSAAAHAEKNVSGVNHSEHRSHAHQGGGPPYGSAKSPEKIHGGQGSRLGKDTD